MAGIYDSIERYPVQPANITPPMRASLFYAARWKAGGGNCLHHEKCEFCRSAVAPNASSPTQSSNLNELIFNTVFYDSVCLKVHDLVSECDTTLKIVISRHDHKYDVVDHKSWCRWWRQQSRHFNRVPIGHKPLNRLVSEVFSVKFTDTQTDRHVDWQTIRVT